MNCIKSPPLPHVYVNALTFSVADLEVGFIGNRKQLSSKEVARMGPQPNGISGLKKEEDSEISPR